MLYNYATRSDAPSLPPAFSPFLWLLQNRSSVTQAAILTSAPPLAIGWKPGHGAGKAESGREEHSQSSPITTRILCFGFASLAAISLLTRSRQLVEIPGHLPKAAVTYPGAGVSAPRGGAPGPCITQALPGLRAALPIAGEA